LGRLPDVLAAAGNGNDLIVIEHRERVPQECFAAVSGVLLGGVPALVVRESTSPPAWQRIAIAWNGAPEAVRAVRAALPILQQAGQVFVLAAPSPRMQAPNLEPEFSLSAYLQQHAVTAQTIELDAQRPTDHAILLACATHAIDLLVLGAFGTTRPEVDDPRGLTRRIIEHASLPLLLCH